MVMGPLGGGKRLVERRSEMHEMVMQPLGGGCGAGEGRDDKGFWQRFRQRSKRGSSPPAPRGLVHWLKNQQAHQRRNRLRADRLLQLKRLPLLHKAFQRPAEQEARARSIKRAPQAAQEGTLLPVLHLQPGQINWR